MPAYSFSWTSCSSNLIFSHFRWILCSTWTPWTYEPTVLEVTDNVTHRLKVGIKWENSLRRTTAPAIQVRLYYDEILADFLHHSAWTFDCRVGRCCCSSQQTLDARGNFASWRSCNDSVVRILESNNYCPQCNGEELSECCGGSLESGQNITDGCASS